MGQTEGFSEVMRVLIYGGGAVGLGIASCLLRSGVEVAIVARPDTVAALDRTGVVRTGIFGRFDAAPGTFTCRTGLDQLESKPYDYTLVCTKSFDSAFAAADLARHIGQVGAGMKLVLFQNGWGNAEAFRTHFAPDRIYNARVITGFRRDRPNEVEVTVHADAIHLGSLFDAGTGAVDRLASAISAGGIPCRTTGDIGKDLWAKMLYNCALNPLGAILGVTYGALAEQRTTRDIMDRIVDEVFSVMVHAGYTTHWEGPRDFLDVFYGTLVPSTAGHKSSMLQDILAGKRTEVDALNGAVIKLADAHGLAAPYNRTVYGLVEFVETSGNVI